jgi:primosomal protein N'
MRRALVDVLQSKGYTHSWSHEMRNEAMLERLAFAFRNQHTIGGVVKELGKVHADFRSGPVTTLVDDPPDSLVARLTEKMQQEKDSHRNTQLRLYHMTQSCRGKEGELAILRAGHSLEEACTLTRARIELDHMRAKYQTMDEQHQNDQRELKDALDEARSESVYFSVRIDDMEWRVQELTKERDLLEQERDLLKQERDDLERKLDRVARERDRALNESGRLWRDLERARDAQSAHPSYASKRRRYDRDGHTPGRRERGRDKYA